MMVLDVWNELQKMGMEAHKLDFQGFDTVEQTLLWVHKAEN